MLGGERQKRRLIGCPHHIQTAEFLRTSETRWPLSLQKFALEGHFDEHKICLGLYIQTRSLWVFLPIEKYTAWVQDIISTLSLTKINTDKLESLIDKHNHAAHIITLSSYFLTKLCNLIKRGKPWGPQRIQSWYRQDLHLWINIL